LAPSRLAGAPFVLSGGVFVASPPSITPTLGGIELLTDPGLEATYTAGLCNSLAKAGSPTLAQSADVHAGGSTKAQEFTAVADNNQLTFGNYTPTDGLWYQFSVWSKRTAGTNNKVRGNLYQVSSVFFGPFISATYAQYVVIRRAVGASAMERVPLQQIGTGYDTIVVDDCSFQALTFPTCLGSVYDVGADGDFKLTVTALTAGTQAGQFFCLDNPCNPLNFGLVYHDGTNLTVVKCLNGVYSNLFTPVAVTYGATKPIWLSKRGPTVTAYYGGTRIGAGSIAESAITNNTIVAPFSTYAGNTFANLDIQAA
jgi:hypothetical protein